MQVDWLSKAAQEQPNTLALSFEAESWTFAQMDIQVWQTVSCLESLGVARKHRVGILAQNSADYIFGILAIARLQAIAVLLNIRLSALEISNQVRNSETNWLICDRPNFDLAMKISQKYSLKLIRIPLILSELDFPLPNSDLDLSRTSIILFTSGTSGNPKPIALSFQNHFSSAIAVRSRLVRTSSSSSLCCLPLFHLGGLAMIWRSLIWRTSLSLLRGFNLQEIHNLIANVNNISLVPTMLQKIIDDPGFKLAEWQRLDYILLGGEAAKPDLIQTCLKLRIPIAPTYGMTEAASQIATLHPSELISKPSSVGKPLTCNTIKILTKDSKENGKELGIEEIEEIGEVIVQGKNIYLGEEKWLHTGDLGYLDSENYLYILQRRTDLIISGGENIYPSQIEKILLDRPDVIEVCVVGKPDPIWGQSVAVVIVSDRPLTLIDIQHFCLAQGLAKYKLPKYIHQVAELPKTASGKIQRHLVRELILEK
jgi:o-succinylbenzoate---CoA ligase